MLLLPTFDPPSFPSSPSSALPPSLAPSDSKYSESCDAWYGYDCDEQGSLSAELKANCPVTCRMCCPSERVGDGTCDVPGNCPMGTDLDDCAGSLADCTDSTAYLGKCGVHTRHR